MSNGKKDEGKVEGYKLTPEHRVWFKSFAKFHQLSERIREGIRIKYGELENLRFMHDEMEGKKKQLRQMAPESIREIEGQTEQGGRIGL